MSTKNAPISIEPITPPKPRWASHISDENWLRLNRLVEDGLSAPAILREMNIPPAKTRSLQLYARNFAARRRIANFESFKETVVNAGAENAMEFRCAYRHMLRLACRDDVDDRTRVRAFEAVSRFVRSLNHFMKTDMDDDKNRDTDLTTLDDHERMSVMEEAVRCLYGGELRGASTNQINAFLGRRAQVAPHQSAVPPHDPSATRSPEPTDVASDEQACPTASKPVSHSVFSPRRVTPAPAESRVTSD